MVDLMLEDDGQESLRGQVNRVSVLVDRAYFHGTVPLDHSPDSRDRKAAFLKQERGERLGGDLRVHERAHAHTGPVVHDDDALVDPHLGCRDPAPVFRPHCLLQLGDHRPHPIRNNVARGNLERSDAELRIWVGQDNHRLGERISVGGARVNDITVVHR